MQHIITKSFFKRRSLTECYTRNDYSLNVRWVKIRFKINFRRSSIAPSIHFLASTQCNAHHVTYFGNDLTRHSIRYTFKPVKYSVVYRMVCNTQTTFVTVWSSFIDYYRSREILGESWQ